MVSRIVPAATSDMTIRAVRRRTPRRGAGNSCASRVRASPPPTVGSARPKASSASVTPPQIGCEPAGHDRVRAPTTRLPPACQSDQVESAEDHAQHGHAEPEPPRDQRHRQQVTQPQANPQDGHRGDGEDGGELGRRHLMAEDVEADGGRQEVGDMVADDDACERRQEQPLGQHRRRADPVPAAPEGAFDAAGQAAGDQQPPAGDVQVPGVDRQQRGGDDGGQGPRAGPAAGDAHDDEQADAQLGERERRGPRHREERGERRRQEDDGLMAHRPASDWSVRHRASCAHQNTGPQPWPP